jgi:hypothetical protein
MEAQVAQGRRSQAGREAVIADQDDLAIQRAGQLGKVMTVPECPSIRAVVNMLRPAPVMRPMGKGRYTKNPR